MLEPWFELGLGPLMEAGLSPGGEVLATMTSSSIHFWYLNGTLRAVFHSPHGMPLTGFGWSPHGTMIAVSDSSGIVRVLSTPTESDKDEQDGRNMDGGSREDEEGFGGWGRVVAVLDCGLWDCPVQPGGGVSFRPLAWSPNGSLIALGWCPGQVHVLAASGDKAGGHRALGPETGWDVGSMAWLPGDLVACSVTEDARDSGSTWILNASTGEEVGRLEGGLASVSPDGGMIAAFLQHGPDCLNVYRSADFSVYARRRFAGMAVSCLAWSPMGDRMAVGTKEGDLFILDLGEGSLSVVANLSAHGSAIASLSWAGPYVSTGSGDREGSVKIWALSPSGELFLVRSFSGWAGESRRGIAVEWFPGGDRLLVYGSHRDPVRVYSSTGLLELEIALTELHGGVASASVSGDGRMIAGAVGTPILVWDSVYGTLATRLESSLVLEARDLAFRPRSPTQDDQADVGQSEGGGGVFGGLLAVVGLGGLEVWDIAASMTAMSVPRQDVGRCVAWSPGGDFVAVGFTSRLQVWGVERSLLVAEEPVLPLVWSVAWSPDGSRLACLSGCLPGQGIAGSGCSAMEIARLSVWDVVDGSQGLGLVLAGEVLVPRGWKEPLARCVSWAPNSSMLVVAAGSEEVVFARGMVEGCGLVAEQSALVLGLGGPGAPGLSGVGRLVGPSMPLSSVSWSPDGSMVAGGSLDGEIRVWLVGPSTSIPSIPRGRVVIVVILILVFRAPVVGVLHRCVGLRVQRR